MNGPLDKFGAFFVQNLRDKMISDLESMLSGAYKAPGLQALQIKLSGFTETEKQVIRELAERNITAGMHDLLFAIADSGGAIRVLVDGQDVVKLSDGLHGEIFGDNGWIARFSKYPSQTEIDKSKWAKDQIEKTFGKKDGNMI